MSINVTRSSMPDYEEYIEAIKDLWDSHWLTNMGEKHRKLQAQLEAMHKVPHVTLYTNGHLALEAAWAVLNLPKGGEVITTPFTFVSTTHAIARSGLIPVFCDVKEDDYTMDPAKIEALITDKTVAICPVHVYGNMCDVEDIDAIAKKYNLKVVYDAAHAFGVTYKGVSSACFGDISMYSFHATKVFNTIEGGALCYQNDDYVQVLNDLKNFGIHAPESTPYIGGNAKMNEFQAAMGLCNLRHFDRELIKRKRVFEQYQDFLGNMDGIRILQPQKDVVPNYAYFPVVFDEYKYHRDQVFDRLAQNNIIARKYFYPITNELECYQHLSKDNTPIAKRLSETVLCLPMYADLRDEDIEKICKIIKESKKEKQVNP